MLQAFLALVLSTLGPLHYIKETGVQASLPPQKFAMVFPNLRTTMEDKFDIRMTRKV